MTYQEANSISIKDYLESLGILPVVDKLYYGMYHSPLRQDDTPSFKVDYGVNLWCDFGTGEGGSLIDLVMKQYGCNAYGAISRLEQDYYSANTFSFQGKNIPEKDEKAEALIMEYVKENTVRIVDPLNIKESAREAEEKQKQLLKELDRKIKFSNATTYIEV